jgi:carbamoyltransferase
MHINYEEESIRYERAIRLSMIEWGISAGAHDAALTVVAGAEILFASHAERYSGIKNDKHLNTDLIDVALKFGKPAKIHWYEKPRLRAMRRFLTGQGLTRFSAEKYLKSFGITAPIEYANHHESHAAAGYYTSKFYTATALVIDAIGEFDTASIWTCAGNEMKKQWSMDYPKSLGLFYSAITDRVGLKPNEDEYILMGMAAYGNPDKYYWEMRELYEKVNLHRGCKWWLKSEDPDYYDLAASAQKIYEEEFEKLLVRAKMKDTFQNNLVLSGGCALNCSANHIARKYFDNIWIIPNPGDAGSSLGAITANNRRKLNWQGPYLGENIDTEYPVENLLTSLLEEGIVGVASGKAEFGPRAFGNRSLLADPSRTDIKDRVNAIKRRQKFRPFAPVILEQHAAEYFDMPVEVSPYMQFTARCKFPTKFPAIIHVDGTSRVQTVNEQQHPGLFELLTRWYEETGCPMLLNTSLNIKGFPMVNDVKDAAMFQGMYDVKVY